MKKFCFLFSMVCLLSQAKAQTVDLSSVSLLRNDSSLLLSSGDTSYVFNAFVLTQEPGGISSVTLVCENYNSGSGQWVPASDTVYTWSQVSNDTLAGSNRYMVCKPNDNLLQVCLGRLYYAVRQRFTFTLSGTNGVFTREFTF